MLEPPLPASLPAPFLSFPDPGRGAECQTTVTPHFDFFFFFCIGQVIDGGVFVLFCFEEGVGSEPPRPVGGGNKENQPIVKDENIEEGKPCAFKECLLYMSIQSWIRQPSAGGRHRMQT